MNQRIVPKLLLGATAALLSTSCAQWEDLTSWGPAVWSDDTEKIAAVKLYFEGKDTVTHLKMRGFESQVYTSDPNAPNTLTALTPILEGNTGALYFMRAKGYIILGRHLAETKTSGGSTSGSTKREIIFDKISLTGSVTEIESLTAIHMLSCDGGQSSTSTHTPLEIVPSPDGSVLAVVKTISDCNQVTTTVSFRDATSLAVIDGPHAVDLNALVGNNVPPGPPGNLPFGMFLLRGWSTGGKFLLTNAGTPDGAWAFAPGQNVQWLTGIDDGCMFPETSSSEATSQKQVIEVDGEPLISAPLTIVNDPNANTFGCP